MTTLQEAAKRLLEAIDAPLPHAPLRGELDFLSDAAADLRAALAALAAPEQEPVAWEVRCDAHPHWQRVDEKQFTEYVSFGWEGRRLYTVPSQSKSLTDEEIDALPWNGSPRQFARRVEHALRSK